MKSALTVKFELPPLEQIPIALKATRQSKKKLSKAITEAQLFAKFGVKPMRIKAQTLALLGKEIQAAGIKHVAHGKILVASENAEGAINSITEIIEKLLKEEVPKYDLIVEMMRLQREFNAQVIHTAQVQFQADKQFSPEKPASITVPFPADSPVMIAVGKPPTNSG